MDNDEKESLKQRVLKYHSFYGGKISTELKCPVSSLNDFSLWYTPGVADVSLAVAANKDLSFEYTNRHNSIAIVSDGTRVLGLGKIGPEAALPVMEGKALLYKYLGGVDAFPIVLNTTTAEDLIQSVLWMQPSFGGINLEDIEVPKCFSVLENLRKAASIPVWHDDQQGTASVIVAGFMNAIKVVGKKIGNVSVTIIGAGASTITAARLLSKAGLPIGNITMVDTKGILNPDREDLDRLLFTNPWKYDLAIKTNRERKTGGMAEAFKGADVCIAASSPGPGIIKKEWIRTMADDSVVFALANPVPEIWPDEAKEGGAGVVATGRSDFPNQVNNSLIFPAMFRGTLDSRATSITDEMALAAANELARYAEGRGLSQVHILPTMDEWEVYPVESAAVALKAVEQGLARRKASRDEFIEDARTRIKASRDQVGLLMKEGLIAPFPK